VTVVEAALSDREAEDALFFEEPGAGETSSLTRGAATAAAVERRVRVTTLDAALAALGIGRIDLLKIDAEGNDLAVLRGAAALLRERRANAVQWEYGDGWPLAGATLGAALSFLDANGYESFLLKGGGLHRFDYGLFGEFFTFANFVSVPRGAPLPAEVRELL
ncbi:MAG TPA: FkbM family methyltransferase, partial [Thermoanaerobaculia bacterium]